MLRRNFLLITATLLLLACQKEADEAVVGYVPSTEAISFDAVTDGAETRAVGEINDNATLQGKGFGVFACLTGKESYENATVSSDFMYNQQVTYASSAWTYSPVKYWPNNADEHISFFAYAPHEATPKDDGRCIIDMSKRTDQGDPWINYRLPAKPWGDYNTTTKEYENPQQIDLLYGVNSATNSPWFDQTKANYDVSQRMTFTFHHALACVGDVINIKTSDDLSSLMSGYAKIYIKKLTIAYKNLTNKARLVLNSNVSPNWKEVISGEVTTTRTLELNYDEVSGDGLFPDDFKPDYTSATDADRLTYYGAHSGITTTATTISTGKGLFYIPLQVNGMEPARADLTLDYQIINNIGKAYEGTATGSFLLNMNLDGKKQAIDITLKEDFKLGVLVYTLSTGATEPSYVRKR